MVGWSALRDAYGFAGEVPALLEVAASGDAAAWQDLWGRLCHQGTTYSASGPALTVLAAMAERESPIGYSEPLGLASAILSSTDRARDVPDPREAYGSLIPTMRGVAESNLARTEGATDFIYCLQILMSFENVPVLQKRLESLANGELELECPGCGESLVLGLGEPDYQARPFWRTRDESPSPLRPASPNSIGPGASRAHSLAKEHGHPEVVDKMLFLLGNATCPCCGIDFSIPNQVDANAADRRNNPLPRPRSLLAWQICSKGLRTSSISVPRPFGRGCRSSYSTVRSGPLASSWRTRCSSTSRSGTTGSAVTASSDG